MDEAFDIIDTVRFVQATRDSGYRSISAALSEVVDNSLQAGASRIDIVLNDASGDVRGQSIAVLDNGAGMSTANLRAALQFGGSERFNDRQGTGRFGMGLPNSSLSQARRVDVYSWREPRAVWTAHLDLDEILADSMKQILPPVKSNPPEQFDTMAFSSGTLVIWTKLDRAQPLDCNATARSLGRSMGRIFRYFLWQDRKIFINGLPIVPFDPLYMVRDTSVPWVKGEPYGEVLTYEIMATADKSSSVEVRFSELPVLDLGMRSNADKRLAGITNGAGVSVVRGGREIDYGWYFLGKRRENYDDWWRCEIKFQPCLDELFGVSHTKQGIRPSETLCSIMNTEMSAIARDLNRRVRIAHIALAARTEERAAIKMAANRERFLLPLPVPKPDGTASSPSVSLDTRYSLAVEKIDCRQFCQTRFENGEVKVALNSMHEFFINVYRPLSERPRGQHLKRQLDLLLLALGRSMSQTRSKSERKAVERFLADWSRAMATFYRSGA